jgi:catechol 2,3-dioxygenase-like lactoylglutathione lyase family enzyme
MRRLTHVLAAAVVVGSLLSYGSAQERPAITGIAFARMYASDTFSSDAFYRMLGFAPEPAGDGPQRYDVTASQWLELSPLPEPAPAARLAEIGFTTRDAAGLQKYLQARGVKVVEPLKDGQFTVLDPEGNRVSFVQTGSHRMTGKRTDGVGEQSSQRIIHVGFHVASQAAEDKFYKEMLGFRDNWHGGMKEGTTDWVSVQVPDGSDWLEYMLSPVERPDPKQQLRELGVEDHFSLGTEHMQDVVEVLAKNGCGAGPQAENCAKTQMGKDGKVQLNVFDPDMTRVEYMEFKPSGPVCCSPILGKNPTLVEDK